MVGSCANDRVELISLPSLKENVRAFSLNNIGVIGYDCCEGADDGKKTIYINYILILLIYINAKIKIFRNITLLQVGFMIKFI